MNNYFWHKGTRICLLMFLLVFATALVGCTKKQNTSSQETTDTQTTVAVVSNETNIDATKTDADKNDDTSYTIENGICTLNGLSFAFPEGFSVRDYTDKSLTLVGGVDDQVAFVIAVDSEKNYEKESTYESFDQQLKDYYGDNITKRKITYNSKEGMEWNLDNDELSFLGRALVICDNSITVYIEYIAYDQTKDAYESVTDSLSY